MLRKENWGQWSIDNLPKWTWLALWERGAGTCMGLMPTPCLIYLPILFPFATVHGVRGILGCVCMCVRRCMCVSMCVCACVQAGVRTGMGAGCALMCVHVCHISWTVHRGRVVRVVALWHWTHRWPSGLCVPIYPNLILHLLGLSSSGLNTRSSYLQLQECSRVSQVGKKQKQKLEQFANMTEELAIR